MKLAEKRLVIRAIKNVGLYDKVLKNVIKDAKRRKISIEDVYNTYSVGDFIYFMTLDIDEIKKLCSEYLKIYKLTKINN